jgi:plasmid stabilization system protein ParE
LLDHIELLARFPRMGSAIQKRPRVRKLVHSPFLIYYRMDDDKRMIAFTFATVHESRRDHLNSAGK